VPEKQKVWQATKGHTGKHLVLGERGSGMQGKGEMWSKVFIVVSAGRKRRGIGKRGLALDGQNDFSGL
jgi:hypothetical protein